ncbi:hypothetical protein LNI88_11585 [Tenacibaculum dicentrarchi]|nr:hypothetical protein [Tenacibaculum dicentrarchi]MCD8426002.1 hypothetical protein [Tenacibaculum dicentrarchi]MCD8443235.1 hypothetical protein [Tenacibaculum dicentrarchi]
MAYLTKSNSLRIIASIDFKKIGNMNGNVYKRAIYFFSYYEKNNLLGLKELLRDPENFIREYYIPIENKDKLKYVFEGGKPAYHSKHDCSRLNSKFTNFEIPEEIRERGKSEVEKFRNWFKKNQVLLEKPDIFIERLFLAFKIRVNPKAIDYDNSGVEIIENLNLQELESRIDKYISQAGQYFNNADIEKKEIIRKFQKFTFLAYSESEIKNNDTRFSDSAIKKFLKQYDSHFKKPIKELLIEYYRVLHNPDLKFEGNLLEQLGFKSCKSCFEDKIHEQLIARENSIESVKNDLPF